MFLSQLFCYRYFHRLHSGLHRPSSFPQWSSNNFAPLSASGVWKRLHAGWMSAIVHWLFINAYILKHFSPSCCLGRFNTTFHWTINESIKLLSSQHFVTAYASEPRMCLVLKRFGGFFRVWVDFFFFSWEMWRTQQWKHSQFLKRGKGWRNAIYNRIFLFVFFFVSVRKVWVFEKH